MTDDEFLKLPHIAICIYNDSDNDFFYNYFLLSPIEEPVLYDKIHKLNVVGSYVMDRSNNQCKLEFPELNYSTNSSTRILELNLTILLSLTNWHRSLSCT